MENEWGRIINVASEAAIKPLPQMIHYSMTKTSVVSLARAMAESTKGTRVAVKTVLPGPTWTAGVKKYFEGLASDEGKPAQKLIPSKPGKRKETKPGTPKDLMFQHTVPAVYQAPIQSRQKRSGISLGDSPVNVCGNCHLACRRKTRRQVSRREITVISVQMFIMMSNPQSQESHHEL